MEWKYDDDLCVCGTKETEIHVLFKCKCYDLVRRRWMRTWDVLEEKERTMDVINGYVEVNDDVENETMNGSKRHSLQAVELSQRTQAAVQIVSNLPAPSNGARFTVFWACRPCGPAGWLALLLTKVGDVETNPGPTTLNKKVWIYDICHKQIHVRKQISIRCNRIEHWVHLRCAGIRQA